MSFTFNWPRFSDQFHYDAIQMLNTALNKGNKPPIIADKIEVVELEMGTQPPELEIRDIGDLTMDQFRGIFRLTYAGDAHLVLKTKVQANPLNHKQPDIHLMTGSRGMLAAKQPLVVPMLLRLSHFKLNSYVVLVVSKQKGITLVFKTDPLQNVDINSTFDSIAVIQKFIQREIEGQLRQMFKEDLPGIIHRLSQQWVKAKVEAPYLNKHPPKSIRANTDTRSVSDMSFHTAPVGVHPHILRQPFPSALHYRRTQSSMSVASTSRRTAASTTRSLPVSPPAVSTPESTSTFPDLENFDPTYGLRPEGLPTKSTFRGFSSKFTPNKGLAGLVEESSEMGDYDDEGTSFDVVDWGSTAPGGTPATSVYDDAITEYESIPAIGGGIITRPRIIHAQSLVQSSTRPSSRPPLRSARVSSASLSSTASMPRSVFATPSLTPRLPFNPYFAEFAHNYDYNYSHPGTPADIADFAAPSPPDTDSVYSMPSAYYHDRDREREHPRRPITPDSLETQHSQSSGGGPSLSTPPSSGPSHAPSPPPLPLPPHPSAAASAASSAPSAALDALQSGSPPTHHPEPDSKIVLRPAQNNSIHTLATLAHSNHTLSPYTRSLEHFAVRSGPPRAGGSPGAAPPAERVPAKARRKRTYRLGGARAPPREEVAVPAAVEGRGSPRAPSEFDAGDMDRYFRAHDEFAPPPVLHPTHVRRRQPSAHAQPSI